jgi:nicotinamidase/pyrazinamidase
MTRLIFWDVDTLHDFMRANGKLYISGSEAIIPRLRALTDFAHQHGIPIVASADNHELSDAEISDHPDWSITFPPHCLKGTPGQLKIPETALREPMVLEPEPQDPATLLRRIRVHRGDFLLHKQTLDVFSNLNLPVLLRALEPEVIVLYGVATDYCNRYAIEGLLREVPGVTIYLVTDAIQAIVPEEGERLITDWAKRGVRMVGSAQILEQGVLDRYLAVASV